MKWGVRRTPEQLGHKKKTIANAVNDGIISEKDLSSQKSSSLRRGIRALQSRISEHLVKIQNPSLFYEDWSTYSDEVKNGKLRHWKHEIKNFKQSIESRKNELKKRGEFNDNE